MTVPLQVASAPDIGDIDATSDLPALVAGAAQAVRWPDGTTGVRDGDVLVVTSKVVAKAEGRVVRCADEDERQRLVESESVRLVARRGPTRIVETHHGLVLAGAGIDASNVPEGWVVLLPVDPDASARRLRATVSRLLGGRRIAVVVTDTLGRAWRMGVTDHAIGVAGLVPIEDLRGSRDHEGRVLERTLVAIADQAAGAAALVGAKDARRPVSVVRGLDRYLLDDDGPGAAALIRPAAEDLFREGRIEQ